MGGLAVLFFLLLYLLIALVAVRKADTFRRKFLTLALLVLVPSADAMLGRLYLRYLCATEGGLKVHRVVQHVEGFMSNTSWDGDYWLKGAGFLFSESPPVNGRVVRYSIEHGKLVTEDGVLPKSQYRLRSLHIGDARDIYLRYQYVIEDLKSGELLASHTEVGFNGGWAERFLAQFSDAGGGGAAWCTPLPWRGNPAAEVVTSTLKH